MCPIFALPLIALAAFAPQAKPSHGPDGVGRGNLVAAGRGRHEFTRWIIDARSFAEGGTLRIVIHLGRGCESSFDLWPSTAVLPKRDFPMSLARAWNVRPGSTREMTYHFRVGQVFMLTGEGSWNADAGATNTCTFKAILEP